MARVYTTPTWLTAAGYDLTLFSTGAQWELVHAAALLVDGLTEQFFNGEPGENGEDYWYLDGAGRELACHRTMVPINFLTAIEVVGSRTNYRWDPIGSYGSSGALDLTYVVNRGRVLERVNSVWPTGPRNLQATAVLGWIEALPDVLSALSTTTVDSTSTTVTLVDSAGFKVRQVLDLIGANETARVIIIAIDRGTHVVTFDALGDQIAEDIEIGATVRTYGTMPHPIVRLANFLVGKMLESEDQVSDGTSFDPSRLKREATDDYEYEMFADEISAARSALTGHTFFDTIVRNFSRPTRPILI